MPLAYFLAIEEETAVKLSIIKLKDIKSSNGRRL